MSKFDLEGYDKLIDNLYGSLSDFTEKQPVNLAYAQSFLLTKADITDLTNKELLLLSNYVRQVLVESSKGGLSANVGEEAAARWFRHITGYDIADFREKMSDGYEDLGLSKVDSKLIDRLREKFNRGDDQANFR